MHVCSSQEQLGRFWELQLGRDEALLPLFLLGIKKIMHFFFWLKTTRGVGSIKGENVLRFW